MKEKTKEGKNKRKECGYVGGGEKKRGKKKKKKEGKESPCVCVCVGREKKLYHNIFIINFKVGYY